MLNSFLKIPTKIGIIGTAGRKDDESKLRLYPRKYWNYMLANAFVIVKDIDDIMFISGGSAWADHIAIHLAKRFNTSCHIFLPSNDDDLKTLQYYHERFSFALYNDKDITMKEWHDVDYHFVKGGFKDRNTKVAQEAIDILIAFTFGTNSGEFDSSITAQKAGLKNGGTADTWNKSNATRKIHFNLNEVLE